MRVDTSILDRVISPLQIMVGVCVERTRKSQRLGSHECAGRAGRLGDLNAIEGIKDRNAFERIYHPPKIAKQCPLLRGIIRRCCVDALIDDRNVGARKRTPTLHWVEFRQTRKFVNDAARMFIKH